MNRNESIKFYEEERDPSKRREKWNAWARKMLDEKKRLEESGEWEDVTKKNEWKQLSSVNFSGHPFENYADFGNFLFPAYACFDEAIFKEGAAFDEATFNGRGDFWKVQFKENGNAYFKNTLFNESVKFWEATFEKKADFSEAIFTKDANFCTKVFREGANFSNAIFKERVDFKRAHFGTSNPNLAEEEEAGEVSFFQTEFKKSADFEGAQFYVTKADFRAIQAERYFNLNNVTFHHCVPDFVQAHFQEAPLLEHFKITPPVTPSNEEKRSFPNAIAPSNALPYKGMTTNESRTFLLQNYSLCAALRIFRVAREQNAIGVASFMNGYQILDAPHRWR